MPPFCQRWFCPQKTHPWVFEWKCPSDACGLVAAQLSERLPGWHYRADCTEATPADEHVSLRPCHAKVTLISAFVFPQLPPKPVNVFFAVCIFLCCVSAGILIYWYRQGDLEPKFRNLIYYVLFSIVMLCICANLYFHEVGKWQALGIPSSDAAVSDCFQLSSRLYLRHI